MGRVEGGDLLLADFWFRVVLRFRLGSVGLSVLLLLLIHTTPARASESTPGSFLYVVSYPIPFVC
jgi:hypothetical protein